MKGHDVIAALRTARRLALVAALPLALGAMSACGSGISLDEPIEGPTWRLVMLGDQLIAGDNDPRRNPQLRFDASGRMNGNGGCNVVAASYTRSGSQLRLSQMVASQIGCTDPARSQLEGQYFQALQDTASYRLSAPGRLALLNASGRTLAVFDANR